jgi:hypothetical protein
MLDPSITKEQAEHLAKIGPKLEAQTSALYKAKEIGKNVVGMQEENQKESGAAQASAPMIASYAHEKGEREKLEHELKNNNLGIEEQYALEGKLEHSRERQSKANELIGKAKKLTGLGSNQQATVRKELEGPKGLYKRAEEAGINEQDPGELAKIEKSKLAQQPGDLAAAIEKLNKVNVEKENEENAKIELTGEAKKWFKLKFPNAKSPKEKSNAGGKSTSSGATNATGAGESAGSAAANKAQEGLSRYEATHGTS